MPKHFNSVCGTYFKVLHLYKIIYFQAFYYSLGEDMLKFLYSFGWDMLRCW